MIDDDDEFLFMRTVFQCLVVVCVVLDLTLALAAIIEADWRKVVHRLAWAALMPVIYGFWYSLDRAVSAWAERAIARVREREED